MHVCRLACVCVVCTSRRVCVPKQNHLNKYIWLLTLQCCIYYTYIYHYCYMHMQQQQQQQQQQKCIFRFNFCNHAEQYRHLFHFYSIAISFSL